MACLWEGLWYLGLEDADLGGCFLGSAEPRRTWLSVGFTPGVIPEVFLGLGIALPGQDLIFKGLKLLLPGRGSKLVMSQGALLLTQLCAERGGWESDGLCLDSPSVYVINLVVSMDTAPDPVVCVCSFCVWCVSFTCLSWFMFLGVCVTRLIPPG